MKLKPRITAVIVAPLIIGAGSVIMADSATAYSTPTRVYVGQPCTPGHNEGVPAYRTEVIYTGGSWLSCYYKVRKFKFWQLYSTDYIGVGKIEKRCPGAPIQVVC